MELKLNLGLWCQSLEPASDAYFVSITHTRHTQEHICLMTITFHDFSTFSRCSEQAGQ